MHRHGLDTVFLAAPTSTERRLKLVAQYSTGFVYLVSRTGVTGERESLSDAVAPLVQAVRAVTDLPLAVGFGISRPEHVARIGPAGGSGGGGQRHRAPDRAQCGQCVARDPAGIIRARVEARLRSAGMTAGRSARQAGGVRVLIDDVDRRIVELLNERTRVVEEIGRVKREAELPIYEPKREDQVFANVDRSNSGPLTPDAVRRIFERIIDEMRNIQRVRMETDGDK